MVARQGLEPRYAAPEAAVLPLNDRATAIQHFTLHSFWQWLKKHALAGIYFQS